MVDIKNTSRLWEIFHQEDRNLDCILFGTEMAGLSVAQSRNMVCFWPTSELSEGIDCCLSLMIGNMAD